MVIQKTNGNLLWKTAVGSVFTIITQSAVVDNGTAYIGLRRQKKPMKDFFPGYIVNPQNCPTPASPDQDFGQGEMMWKVKGTEYVGAGQKGGQFWALNPDTGAVIWATQAARSSAAIAGGTIYWGSGYSNFGAGTPNNKLFAFSVK